MMKATDSGISKSGTVGKELVPSQDGNEMTRDARIEALRIRAGNCRSVVGVEPGVVLTLDS
jgi:hypothetical protein